MEKESQKRIAVVGSGLAGLLTSYLLQQDIKQRYAVTLFEEAKTFSLDAASLSVPNSSGGFDRVDLPMRAFTGGYYNNLKALYDHLKVEYRPRSFLFSFSKLDPDSEKEHAEREATYYIHTSNSRQIPPLRPRGPPIHRYVLEIVYLLIFYTYFTLCCRIIRPSEGGLEKPCESLEQYLSRIRLPKYFATNYVLPLYSSVTTCSHAALLGFPASDLIDYKWRTRGTQHYTVTKGVGHVQEILAKGIPTRFSAHVLSIEPQKSGRVRLQWRQTENNDSLEPSAEEFDSVILAVPPNVVGKTFRPLQNAMRRTPTFCVESIAHRDDENLGSHGQSPIKHTDRLHSIVLRSSTSKRCTESIDLQASNIFITTNPFTPINKESIISHARFTRVLRTPESREVINQIFGDDRSDGDESNEPDDIEKGGIRWKNGEDNVWLVGGWCWDGMVLLEGCVVSALRVSAAFCVDAPWKS